jgi:uncharacterized membrane protein YhhN
MPFAGDLTSSANGTLALSVVAAILYAFMQASAPSWRRTVAKTAPVLLLAALSFTAGGPWLLTAGLLASAAGDAALAEEGERPFLAGLAAFLLAHLLYIGLFATHWRPGFGLFAAAPWRVIAVVALLVFCAFMVRRLLPALSREMRLPVTAYVAAITVMGLAAFGVPGLGVIAGAALFVASDAILATQKFLLAEDSWHRTWTGHAVWILYYAAQLLITLAFLL